MNDDPEHSIAKAMEMEAMGMLPASTGGMPPPCRECGGVGKVNWKDASGDVKEKTCPRCHGKRVAQGEGGGGYRTK
jgi:DnaJ-class molecular chaperone